MNTRDRMRTQRQHARLALQNVPISRNLALAVQHDDLLQQKPFKDRISQEFQYLVFKKPRKLLDN